MTGVQRIKISDILVKHDREFGGYGLVKNLAASIKAVGLINPITVREELNTPEFKYTIVAGRRRLAAVKELGEKEIQAVVIPNDTVADEVISLAENVNRLDMHPVDEGVYLKKLINKGKTIDDLSKIFGRSTAYIYQRIKLCNLTDNMKLFFKSGKLTITQAAQIACLPFDVQEKIYKEISKNKYFSGVELSYVIRRQASNKLDFPCKKCEFCLKRTRYTDNNLFPELDNEDDYCFDYDCFFKNKLFYYNDKLTKFAKNYKDLEFLFVSAVEDEYLHELKQNFNFKIEKCDYSKYSVIPDKMVYSLEEKVRKAVIPFYDISKGELNFVVEKNKFNKLFSIRRNISDVERAVINSLPEEVKNTAEEIASNDLLIPYSKEMELQYNVVFSQLKDKFCKKKSSLKLSKKMFSFLNESLYKQVLSDAFKMLTGVNINSVKDIERFNFTRSDYLELYSLMFFLKIIEENRYNGVNNIAAILDQEPKDLNKLLIEEMKKYIIEVYASNHSFRS